MIKSITTYNIKTGEILRNITCSEGDIKYQYNPQIEYYIEGIFSSTEYYIVNDIPIQLPPLPNEYSIFDYNTKQWVDSRTNETEWNLVIEKRYKLLVNTDWTQMPDVAIATKSEWATYRQALRDITTQSDPFNIVWPVPPGG